jgi:hypothetical protein
MWSRIGRLRRATFPKLTGGGHTFGGGAGPGLMAALAGRLLCDTYLSGANGRWTVRQSAVYEGNAVQCNARKGLQCSGLDRIVVLLAYYGAGLEDMHTLL